MDKPKVLVLMSTYNGEEYIKEQVNSILDQKDIKVQLLIRDDGSSDKTVQIISQMIKKSKNIRLIQGDNIGYANSFLSLFLFAESADYYAFADQDDIWKQNKLNRAIDMINNKSGIYASALQVVDENLEYLHKKEYQAYKYTVGSILSRNRLSGCTMVFDNEIFVFARDNVKEIIKFNSFNYGHDGWLLLLAKILNKPLIIDSETEILYRRHAASITNIHGGLRKRLKNEWRIFRNKEKKRQKVAYFLVKHISTIPDDSFITLSSIIDYKTNIKSRIYLITTDAISTGIKIVDLKNKAAVIFGLY